MPQGYILPMSFDAHVHLRQGPMRKKVQSYTNDVCSRALVMPNITPPAENALAMVDYLYEIRAGCEPTPGERSLKDKVKLFADDDRMNPHLFQPLGTILLTSDTTPEIIVEAAECGCKAGKLFPLGVTNATRGVEVSNLKHLDDPGGVRPAVFAAMSETGMILSVHAEMPPSGPVDFQYLMFAEQAFLERGFIADLAAKYPQLKIVVEHVSSAFGIDYVKALPETVAGTITATHLWLTCDDWMQGFFNKVANPHNYCRPVVKTLIDQRVLAEAATESRGRFFSGLDSAPHKPENKAKTPPSPGVFSAPVALPILADIFDRAGAMDNLANFACRFGEKFYGLEPTTREICLVEREWQVPPDYNGIVSLAAGETLGWQVWQP